MVWMDVGCGMFVFSDWVMCVLFIFFQCVKMVWDVCVFLWSNSKVRWCVLLCDFLAVCDVGGPMRIFFVIFEIWCGWMWGVGCLYFRTG